MQFLHPAHDEQLELSLDDVFVLPGDFDGSTRLDTDLTPEDFPGGCHPVVASNMNAVTGRRMAEAMARLGGLGVLPQDMDATTVERIVAHIKTAEPRFDTPLSVTPDATLRDVQGIIRKRAHEMVVVVDARRHPIGIVTQADLRKRDQYTPVHRIMSTEIVTVPLQVSNREAFRVMERYRVKAVPVVDGDGLLRGILGRDDTVRQELLRPALDSEGRLLVAAALSISGDPAQSAATYASLGVDAIVLDTAHGHQRAMREAIGSVRAALGDGVPIVAGNVCTAEGTRDLIQAGANVVKVNIGPGAMCTTRMQTGIGRPTFTSVLRCAHEARRLGCHVWADGGVRAPRDVALYLAAGAARVMVGTVLAGTYESPGDIKEDREGHMYKENHGMASTRAVSERTADLDPFERAKRSLFREGISASRIYIQEGRESVGAILTEILTGLQSAFTYAGARDCAQFHANAVVGVQSTAGFQEGKPRFEV
jgi:IMP dehydrogenase